MSERTISRTWWVLAAVVLTACIAAVVVLYRAGPPGRDPGADALPGPGSAAYQDMVSAFYSGVAAMDSGADAIGKAALTRATRLVPGEPAAWANLGLLQLRIGDADTAGTNLSRASALAPESGEIERLLALLESRRGDLARSIAHMKRTIELDPTDLKTRFALAKELERQGEPGGTAEALRQLAEILKAGPENLAVLLERARIAAKEGDAEALRDTVARLGRLAPTWPEKARSPFKNLEQAASGKYPREAATRALGLRHVLVSEPAFQQSNQAVQLPEGKAGEPIEYFLRLKNPPPTPSPRDEGTSFASEPLAAADKVRWDAVFVLPSGSDGPTVPIVANGRIVRPGDGSGAELPFPGGPKTVPPSAHGVAVADWDSDSDLDLVAAGAGGVRLFRQEKDGAFADATAATGLKAEILGADAFGVWVADVELDGDLDFVIGMRSGSTLVLRNHGDGTFEATRPFAESSDLRGFAWADFDQDGTPDAGILNARGELAVLSNERAGRFRPRALPKDLGTIAAVTIADANSDGEIDLVALKSDGAIVRISDRDEGRAWDVAEISRWPVAPKGPARLIVADLDNNGGPDLIGTDQGGSRAWLGDETGRLHPLAAAIGVRAFAVADLNGDGRLDLAGLAEGGRAVVATGRGTRPYHWQVVRPRAKAVADGRINSFGLGGEVQVRAGLLVQKQVIEGPIVHFGLGDHPKADVSRVVWPNGTMQAEFDTKADEVVVAEQRLSGSCPFVYAFDGERMRFVTDFLWRSPLGLRINAQDTAGVGQTEDWIKIRGDQLSPRDGHYDVRITAELWETHYFDHVSLMVVDHPEGTEVFVDERFARKAPVLAVHPTGPLHPVDSARDDRGLDVTEEVRARDGRYLDTFGRGPYQGVTRDHWVEVEIGPDMPSDRKLVLVAQGWIHPTDSSINVALGQGRHDPPQGLVLEVPTPEGKWIAARSDLGFPAGKNKTILVDLEGVFRPGTPRRLRLRTNLEIFWDALAVAAVEDGTTVKTRRIAPASVDLRHRGYSLMTQADAGSPELPDYETLTGTRQRWRDLVGFYTRYGDVRELLETVDDRYAILNAGDEAAFRFPAPDAPPSGWKRDFVLIGDGWNKDGNFNTAFSRTVLPLPSHDRPGYDAPPGDLEDDPVFRKHPEDWEEYHTRYITPRTFRGGLRP